MGHKYLDILHEGLWMFYCGRQWCNEGEGGWGFKPIPPPPEIPKALQNRAKLNPIVKTVKNC